VKAKTQPGHHIELEEANRPHGLSVERHPQWHRVGSHKEPMSALPRSERLLNDNDALLGGSRAFDKAWMTSG